MSLYFGGEVKDMSLGGTHVKEAWLGGVKVWSKSSNELVIDGIPYRIGEMPDGRIWMIENVQVL